MHLNNSSEELIKMSEERGESILLKTGALVTETGFTEVALLMLSFTSRMK